MNIHLISNNTTFGTTYTSPPKIFTTGQPIQRQKISSHEQVSSFHVENKACFVNVVKAYAGKPEEITTRAWGFGRLIEDATASLSYLNSEIRFISADAFTDCERIPIKELADRNIAVLSSEKKYNILGDVGAENRRQSFYCNKTTVHSHFHDNRIDDLAKLGFFFKPLDMHPMHCDYSIDDNDDRDDSDQATNISFTKNESQYRCFINWTETHIVEDEFKKHSSTRPDLFDYSACCELLDHPIIESDRSTLPAIISYIYSPNNSHFSILIRHPDVQINMLSNAEMINARHQAFLDYNSSVTGSLAHRAFANPIREAQFFNKPYGNALEFCDNAIEALQHLPFKQDSNLTAVKTVETVEQEKNATEFKKSIFTAINQLGFAKCYMTEINDLVKNAILHDDIHRIIKKNNKKESNQSIQKSAKSYKEENNNQLLSLELSWIQKAVDQDILKKDDHYHLLYLHTIIYTSINQLIMENSPCMDKKFKETLHSLKEKSEKIIRQIDDKQSKIETLDSLKTQIFFLETDAIDDKSETPDTPPSVSGLTTSLSLQLFNLTDSCYALE